MQQNAERAHRHLLGRRARVRLKTKRQIFFLWFYQLKNAILLEYKIVNKNETRYVDNKEMHLFICLHV